MVAADRTTNVVGQVQKGSPAAAAHLQVGDRILRVQGQAVQPKDIPAHIRATGGASFKVLVVRKGQRVTVGPLRAREDSGAYRIGIAIEAKTGPGESLPAATRDALGLTWRITADTVRGIGHLATGRDTNQVSSSVGIVRVSAAAWRQGARDFLFVLGLVSLALGLLNLLPVLPLDGGHIVMALAEKLRGQTFRQAVYVRYSVLGLTLFAVLMYFGLRNDLFGGGG
jgi:regulator of sigma E protease